MEKTKPKTLNQPKNKWQNILRFWFNIKKNRCQIIMDNPSDGKSTRK